MGDYTALWVDVVLKPGYAAVLQEEFEKDNETGGFDDYPFWTQIAERLDLSAKFFDLSQHSRACFIPYGAISYVGDDTPQWSHRFEGDRWIFCSCSKHHALMKGFAECINDELTLEANFIAYQFEREPDFTIVAGTEENYRRTSNV